MNIFDGITHAELMEWSIRRNAAAHAHAQAAADRNMLAALQSNSARDVTTAWLNAQYQPPHPPPGIEWTKTGGRSWRVVVTREGRP